MPEPLTPDVNEPRPIYLTLQQLAQRPEDRVIVNGREVTGRSLFTVAKELGGEELQEVEADVAQRLMAQLRRMEAQARLKEALSLSAREHALIANCQQYAQGEPAGLPGHNLMIVVAKLANALGL